MDNIIDNDEHFDSLLRLGEKLDEAFVIDNNKIPESMNDMYMSWTHRELRGSICVLGDVFYASKPNMTGPQQMSKDPVFTAMTAIFVLLTRCYKANAPRVDAAS